ncbi:DUF202 domain-containing protein [Pseudonocardia sp.]|uniref:DUF202 domain-containing protein n=1 Tax=Pseudonocardia sp. TaxID=60912 RepID=UPI003D0A85EE
MTADRSDLPESQRDRTVLAWDRTALGVLANGGLLLLRQLGVADLLAPLSVVAAVLGAVVLVGVGARRSRAIGRALDGPRPVPFGTVATGGAVVAAIGVLAAAAVLGPVDR